MPEPPDSDALVGQVIAVIAKTQRIPKDAISLESTFEELKIDSLDGINIVFALESEFDINIPDDGLQNLRSVHDTVAGVRELIDQKALRQDASPA